MSKSTDNKTLSIDKCSLNVFSNSNVWVSLFSIVYDVDTMHCKLYVDKTCMFDKINGNLPIDNYNASVLSYELISNVYTTIATDALLAITNTNIALKINATTLTNSYYTNTSCDSSLNAKLTNTTGAVAMAIKNNYDVDVAIFYNTKDVELNGSCYVYNNLSVLGTTTFGNAISLSTPSQGGGNLRIIADVDGDESSI